MREWKGDYEPDLSGRLDLSFSPIRQVSTTSNIGETLWFRHGLTATTIRIPGNPVGGYDGGIDKILRGWYWVEFPSWESFYHVWEVKSRVSKRLD